MVISIYFDNSATTFPKPQSVCQSVCRAVTHLGGNPGRGGHIYSQRAAEVVYTCREELGEIFSCSPENVIFTQNCTHALNMAIKGICKKGDRIVISSVEHNSVARPCYKLALEGCDVQVAFVRGSDDEVLSEFARLITPSTKCVIATAASNVTGRVLPVREISKLCKAAGAVFIVDGAQACGLMPLSLEDGANIICSAGHKGLYGPTGTGVLMTDGKYPLDTLTEGGTGATSMELTQTVTNPEHLESGTLNTVGIAGLLAGVRFVKEMTITRIHAYESMLCDIFIDGIRQIPDVKIYRDGERFSPIVSFNIDGIDPSALTNALSEEGFALRGGIHCSPLAHITLGTAPTGTVRFSPSVFNNEKQVISLINITKKISKTGI